MIIFEPAQKLMKWLGFHHRYLHLTWYRCYRCVVYSMIASMFLPMGLFAFANISDISFVAETLAVCSAELNSLSKGLVYILYNDEVRTVCVELQRLVDEKERQGRLKHYTKLNADTNYWIRRYILAICMCILALGLKPMMFVLYYALKGNLTRDKFTLPLSMIMPFDPLISPAYELTFILCTFFLSSLGFVVAMADGVFMGQCALIMASQIDLQDMLIEIVDDARSEVHVNATDQYQVNQRLVKCVEFHNQIIRIIDVWGKISTPIISAQIFLSVLQLGTLAFGIEKGENLTIDQHITNFIIGTASIFDLFIYCYYGNEVTVEGLKVADPVYNSSWYKCSPKYRRYYRLMLQEAQKPQVIKGFKMIPCTLETFASTLNMVGSSVALLRSMA